MSYPDVVTDTQRRSPHPHPRVRRRSWSWRTSATPSCSTETHRRDAAKRELTSRHRQVCPVLSAVAFSVLPTNTDDLLSQDGRTSRSRGGALCWSETCVPFTYMLCNCADKYDIILAHSLRKTRYSRNTSSQATDRLSTNSLRPHPRTSHQRAHEAAVGDVVGDAVVVVDAGEVEVEAAVKEAARAAARATKRSKIATRRVARTIIARAATTRRWRGPPVPLHSCGGLLRLGFTLITVHATSWQICTSPSVLVYSLLVYMCLRLLRGRGRGFACFTPCHKFAHDRSDERGGHGREQRRVHGILVLCGEVEEGQHARVEERARCE